MFTFIKNVINVIKENIFPLILTVIIIIIFAFFNEDVVQNIFIPIIFEVIILKAKEIEISRKKCIIEYKVKKFNEEIENYNNTNTQNLKETIFFNENFYDKSYDFSFSIVRILIYCCFTIPFFIFNLSNELGISNFIIQIFDPTASVSEKQNLVFYFKFKFIFCFICALFIFLISVILILSNKENRIYTELLKKRNTFTNNIKYDNGDLVFDDEQIIYIGDYTEEELKILNNDNDI